MKGGGAKILVGQILFTISTPPLKGLRFKSIFQKLEGTISTPPLEGPSWDPPRVLALGGVRNGPPCIFFKARWGGRLGRQGGSNPPDKYHTDCNRILSVGYCVHNHEDQPNNHYSKTLKLKVDSYCCFEEFLH